MKDNFYLLTAFVASLLFVGLLFSSMTKCHAAERMVTSYYGSESGSQTASVEAFHQTVQPPALRRFPLGTASLVGYRDSPTFRGTVRGRAKWTHRPRASPRGPARKTGILT